MARIDVGRITLNVEEKGEGPPFIFIPGLVGLLNAWQYQVEEFSKHYRCISFDHRGAGDSDKPPLDQYSTLEISEDVIALLDTLGIEKAHMAGTSTGGAILQNLAIDHPDRLRACVFSNTWTTADEYIKRVQTTRKRIAESYGPEAYVEVSTLWTCGAYQFRNSLDKVFAIEARAKKTVAPVEVLAGRLDMTLSHDRTSELHKITNPSLVIGTKDDATVPGYFAEDLHKAIGNSRLALFDEGGHDSCRSKPELWNGAVEGFFEEIAKTG